MKKFRFNLMSDTFIFPEDNREAEDESQIELTEEEQREAMELSTINQELQLVIPLEAYRKIMGYTTVCNTEITGFADIVFDKENKKFIVEEVYLLEQEAGSTTVHMDEEVVAKFNHKMIKDGREQLPQMWWHSHVNMAVFLSGTDEDTLKDLQNNSFIIALVVNKRYQMKAKMYVYKHTITEVLGETVEERSQITIEDLPVHVQVEYLKIPATITKEVEKKVKAHKQKSWKSGIFDFNRNDEEDDKKGKRRLLEPKIYTGREHNGGITQKEYSPVYRTILTLPKNPEDAEKKIEAMDLVRTWDYTAEEFVWVDPDTQNAWVDYWGALSRFGDLYKGEK